MKRDLVIAAIAVLIVTAIAFGLAAVRPNLPGTPSSPFSGGDKDADAESKPGKDDKIVMTVNGQPVTEREFNMFVLSAPEQARAFYASPMGRRALADELVKLKILEQEAKKMGLADDPELKTQLAMTRAQLMASRALEKLADAKSEEKIRAEYQKEKAGSISLRHILLAYQGGQVPPRNGQPPAEAATMEKANALAARLRGGADFAQTARAESDDVQSGANGGMLGPARPDALPPDIAGVVSKLKPGQISDPLKTQFGIHIFKVEEPSLEDLRPMLRQKVRQQVAEEEVARLEKGAKVDLDPKFFPPQPQQQQQAPAPGSGVPPKTNG